MMHILIVDDEPSIRKVLRRLLLDEMHTPYEAGTISEANALLDSHIFDIAIVDLRLPDGSGINLLKTIKEKSPDTTALMITAFATTETAIEAMKLGAYDYVIKPFNLDEIRISIRNICEKIALKRKVNELQQYADEDQKIIGKSAAMKTVFNMIEKIAPFDTNVLITGESGTGKELVSREIHYKSRRSERPFVAISCANLPGELLESELFGHVKGAFTGAYRSKRGLIQEANSGSLFLDEIGEMPPSLQAKMLRFLEDKKIRPVGGTDEIEVDVRVISATNRPLKEIMSAGGFREDLYYRLSSFEINLPPLIERQEDIPLLVDHFVKFFSKKLQKEIREIDPAFVDAIMKMGLKGNVRELKNIIERAVILSENGHLDHIASIPSLPKTEDLIEPLDKLPDEGFDLNLYLSNIERELLETALRKTVGKKTKAAELLGLSFREFRYRLSKYKNMK
ncbi:MAG: sigma-54 dependent transcriptional regulator [Nitrospirae bacterium]|nr:sigma-54 dependent transcriptional regulator [Nitrospirota bacterium]